MSTNHSISFDDTESAFAYKKNAELKNAHFLFTAMGKPWLVNIGLKFTPLAIKWQLPFTTPVIKKTIFQQFVGGETLEATAPVAKKLGAYHVECL